MYDHKSLDKKWQDKWEQDKVYVAQDNTEKPKQYVLIEFPYPSGAGLHMGHLRPYVAGDVYSRHMRMRGFETMYPIGWDAFGLPAENFAIKNGVHPSVSTKSNIQNAKKQIKSWGLGFDWSREVNTTDSDYYKWTQWIFLKLYEAGLAYEATGLINWCPKDKTGLANEEVVDGKCERCGETVEKKELRQWYLKITAYAQKLLDGLKTLSWPEAVKVQQENWIGRSEGAMIKFPVAGKKDFIEVFTTRPDTLFGATYMVLAPDHKLVEQIVTDSQRAQVAEYARQASVKSEMERTALDKEKTGVFTGAYAINPATEEEIPVWIADYVLSNYGTGAIMAVPAHDERDFEFAKKFNLEIKKVIEPIFEDSKGESAVRKGLQFVERNAVSCIVKHWEKDEFIILRWKEIDWTTFVTGGIEANETPEIAGLREIREETGYQNAQFIRHLGKVHSKFYHNPKKENRFAHFHVLYYELTDDKSLPLSDVENKKHKVEWVSRDEVKNVLGPNGDWFSWKLFKDPHTVYTGEGIAVDSGEYSSLSSQEARLHMTADFGRPIVQYKLRDWVFSRQRYWGEPIPLVHCEKCGTVPVPENQLPLTLPEVEKYEPTGTGESPLAAIDSWVNTTCPKCIGPAKRETNTMPQWAGSSWYFLRYADPTNERELASKDKLSYWQPVDVYFGGMEHTTLHLLYSRFWNLFLFDIGVVTSKEPYLRRIPHGIILGPDGEKMSKSRGNVVNPDDVVAQYGADTLRMYEMFLGPHEQVIAWNDKGIIGVKRFLDRVCDFVPDPNAPAVPEIHRLIKKVTEDLAAFKFNTSVAAFMEFLKNHKMNKDDFEVYLKLLAPFAPHATDELWHKFGHERSIHQEAWPSFDPGKIALTEVVVAVQVLGKTRGTILIKAGSSQQEVEDAAKQLSAVAKQLEGWEIIKVVFVADRLINFVVK